MEFTGGADDPLLAPALAAGTTTVVKMPGQTAQTNALVARIIAEAPSLPAGTVNIFSESGSEGARRLIDAAEVPVISFTGSSATGRAISAAGARHLKRFGLELGGKTPHLVFDDADLDAALPVLEKSLTVFAGQFCMTGSRLLVQRGVAERLRERLAQRLENLRVGPAADPRSDMGPLIDKANVERVERAVRQAIAAGARVVVRGGPVTEGELAAGAFYRPTLLEVDDPDLDIVQQETFGPVLTLQVFDREEGRRPGQPQRVRAGGRGLDPRGRACLPGGAEDPRRHRVDQRLGQGLRRIRGGRLPPVRPRPAERVAALDDFVEYKHISLTTGAA